ncbi:MAG: sigma-70 family RNA polymerase sigma factor [Ignavibacteriaceae bacterium]|nr:sigma-70 family RNA polymerase sigma factor [Ignavibacteriaceae bacterium]
MPTEIELTDFELMQKIAAKDSKSLELLYDRYSPVLYTLIHKIVRSRGVAEEVLADIFLIIWKKYYMFDMSTENVYSWLIMLARNKAVDSKKRMYGQMTIEYSDNYEDEKIVPLLSKEIDPLDLNTALEIRPHIDKAFHTLTDAQRYVLNLAYYEGMSETEIAERLKIPVQTVKTKIRIAINNLKNLIRGSSL